VDSKRNRNIEGTGLGLAISKQLLLLMDGDIQVESEYERGSKFSFSLPQKVVDWTPGVVIEPVDCRVAAYVKNEYVKEQLEKDVKRFGAEYVPVAAATDLENLKDVKFLFIDMQVFSEKIENYLKQHQETSGVLLVDYQSMMEYRISNLRVVKKPIYSYVLKSVFEGHEFHENEGKAFDDFTFIAPEARVLIVDDNEVNLTVAKGLLKPLKMKVETASSGKEAVYKISAKMYDLIFMDHMMPEIDGVETTRIIRRLHPEYSEVPIIALTANVVDGTREMFIEEEMNDLVAKPIDVKDITDKVRKWLPEDKIVRVEAEKPKKANDIDFSDISVSADGKKLVMNKPESKEDAEKESALASIKETLANAKNVVKNSLVKGLDTETAIKRLGTEELFWEVLKDYYHSIERKAKQIKQLEKDENWEQYTIEVHALKSASKQIGAMELGNLAEELEMAGKAGDIPFIKKKTNKLLSQYLQYQMILKYYFPEEEKQEGAIPQDVLKMHLLNLKNAAGEMDVDMMDGIVAELSQFEFKDKELKYFELLQTAVEELDTTTCEETVDAWNEYLLQ
jgi:CheY-like chemotaxis protein